jgi:GNAT superfamily N-acetyltransferase
LETLEALTTPNQLTVNISGRDDAGSGCFTQPVADHFRDTASQRSPTGLDESVRNLILRVLGANPAWIVDALFEDAYIDYEDYVRAVSEVWGSELGARIYQAVSDAQFRDEMRLGRRANVAEEQARALVLLIPEPDFRIAVLKHIKRRPVGFAEEERINQICRARGVPWSFTVVDGFAWVGDQEVETQAIQPALSAISDPRFAGGVKTEFDTARYELALGTPTALKR